MKFKAFGREFKAPANCGNQYDCAAAVAGASLIVEDNPRLNPVELIEKTVALTVDESTRCSRCVATCAIKSLTV